jgi:hypothetical protein
MHREMRSSLKFNFSQWFEFKGEKREDIVRKVNKYAMGIRLSRSLVKKNSGSRALLNSGFRREIR